MRVTAHDIDTMARTIWGEARGESYLGQVAVAWVIRNRADANRRAQFGEGIEGVCLKPYQFSCWNAGDPNRGRLLAATLLDETLVRAYGIACLVITGDLDDPTRGALYYHTVDIRPSWASAYHEVARIGRHVFRGEAA